MFPKSVYNINIDVHFGDLDHSRSCVVEILMSLLERICVLLVNLVGFCKEVFFLSSHNFEVVQSQLEKGRFKH